MEYSSKQATLKDSYVLDNMPRTEYDKPWV